MTFAVDWALKNHNYLSTWLDLASPAAAQPSQNELLIKNRTKTLYLSLTRAVSTFGNTNSKLLTQSPGTVPVSPRPTRKSHATQSGEPAKDEERHDPLMGSGCESGVDNAWRLYTE